MINIYDETQGAVTPELIELINRVAGIAVKVGQLHYAADIELTITDAESIKEINAEQRGIDAVTDVLSFPMVDWQGGEDPEDEVDPDTGALFLGDIMICLERAKEQAEEYGHSLEREIGFLTAHGVLHLLGYDHIEPEDEQEMLSAQKKIMRIAELPRDGQNDYEEETDETEVTTSGFAALIGRPNVGKSTIMNYLVEEKVSIISDRPQTTRNQIRGIYTKDGCQIVFIDTPGMHTPRTRLGNYMMSAARAAVGEVDTIIAVFDGHAGVGKGDRAIIEELTSKGERDIICVLNKVDLIDEERKAHQLRLLGSYPCFKCVIPVSAVRGDGMQQLEQTVRGEMPEGPAYFPADMYTDQPERFLVAEIIREKTLKLLFEEVPHGIGVDIVEFKEREDSDIIDINVNILCERSSHKGIIIGRPGAMLKKIGSQARSDIESLLGNPVNLQLWVKVRDDWRNSAVTLQELGYNEKEF